jgi:hypothetical protein
MMMMTVVLDVTFKRCLLAMMTARPSMPRQLKSDPAWF